MRRNKTHKARDVNNPRYTICGVDRGKNYNNQVPISREDRDVTCLRCKRIIKKGD